MAIYKRDIASINLETGTIHRTFMNHSIGYKDQKADHFGIRVFRDGEPVDLTGVSVQGVFMPPQGDPIAITSGNIVSGNEAEVVLPQACYNYDGQFCLAIKLVDSNNSVTGTMRIVDGMVDNTHASGTVAPTSAVPTYQEILSTYDAMVAATAAANGAIAPLYANLTFPVKAGQYAIVDGALKRAIVDIATSEAYTAAHWTAAKLGPDLSDLKSAIDDIYKTPYANDFSLVSGGLNSNTGADASATNRSRTVYIPITVGQIYSIVFDSEVYSKLTNFTYSSQSASSKQRKLTNAISMRFTAQTNENYLRMAFKRKDDADMTDSDRTAIKTELKIYTYTDEALANAGCAADAKVTGEGFELAKNELDNLAKETYIEKSGFSPEITRGKYRDFSTNTLTTQTGYAIMSASFQKQQRVAVSFNNSNYQFGVMTYSNSEQGSANLIHGYGWYDSGEMVILPINTVVFVIQWKKIDGTAITSEEEAALQSGIRIYELTDSTLSMQGKAADAKATNDKIMSTNELAKNELDNLAKEIFTEKSGFTQSIVLGKYRQFDTGTLVTATGYAVMASYLTKKNRAAVSFANESYQFGVMTYSGEIAAANLIRGYGWYNSGEMVILPINTKRFSIQWKKIDGTAIASEEETALKEGIRYYELNADDSIASLKVLVTGDSICRGGRNGHRGFIGDVGCQYVNIGIGGASISTVKDSSSSTDTDHVMGAENIPDTIVKYATMSSESWYIDPDVIIAEGGVNDYANDAQLGVIPTQAVRDDTGAAGLDLSTVTGGLAFMFYKMITLFPNAHRFFLITHRTGKWPWVSNAAGYNTTQLHDAIIAVCKLYSVDVIDVYDQSFVNSYFPEYVSPTPFSSDHSVTDLYYVDKDQIHPLALGYRTGYAPLVKVALQKAVNL